MSRFNRFATFGLLLTLTAGGLCAQPVSREQRTRAIDLLSAGQLMEREGDTQGAYQKFYESATLAPSPSAYYHLGRLCRQAGQKDTAKQWLDLALSLNPNFELAKVELMQLRENARGDSRVVQTVSAEMRGDVAPGSARNLNTPMNVDALRREVITMQSLAPRETAGTSQVGAIEMGTPQSVGGEETRSVAAAAPAEPRTPMDIELDPLSDDANPEVSSLLSPTLSPSEQGDVSLPPLLTEDREVAQGNGDEPSAAAINEAAFGEESQGDPGSKGYGQTNEIALGTFAFHREKGDNYRKANRFQDAAVEYQMALELSPGDAETRALLAEMYGRLSAPQRAQAQFAKAKAQDPDNDDIYYKEGNAYFDDQKYDLAIGSYRQAVAINPQNKLALNNMGVAYMEKKQYALAAEKFKEVLELDPDYDLAVLNLGIIYDEHIIDKAQALVYYDRYLALKGPRSTEVKRWAETIRARQSQ